MRPLVEREHIDYALQRHNLGQFQKSNSDWQIICQRAKSTISGTEQQKNNQIRERVLRFFGSYSSVKIDEPAYSRNDVNFSNPFLQICQNSLVLYGCDLMSTRRVESYFGTFSVDIQWLNDSHCKVTFKDRQTAIQAIIANAVYQTKKYLKSHERKIEDFQKQWFELNPYYELCFQRKLMIRFATNLDVQDSYERNKKKLFYDYNFAKREFIKQANRQKDEHRTSSRSQSYSNSRSRSSQGSNYRNFGDNSRSNSRSRMNQYPLKSREQQASRFRSRQKNQFNLQKFHQDKLKNKSPRTNYHSNINNYNHDRPYYQKRKDRQMSSVDSFQNRQIRQNEENFRKYIEQRDRKMKEKEVEKTKGSAKSTSTNSKNTQKFNYVLNKLNETSFLGVPNMDEDNQYQTIKEFQKFLKGINLNDSNLSEFDITDGMISMGKIDEE